MLGYKDNLKLECEDMAFQEFYFCLIFNLKGDPFPLLYLLPQFFGVLEKVQIRWYNVQGPLNYKGADGFEEESISEISEFKSCDLY